MKNLKLQKLNLKNFQGIKNLSIELGEHTAIYGDNATGKTTIANAISWLLYDKSSTGEKGFSPKTIGKDGVAHGLDHEVAALFSSGLELRKVFCEKYVKSRGKANKEFSGHTTDYYINGVPSKKKDFDNLIEESFGSPERLQILTDPLFFAEDLPWEKRRAILIGMSGGLTDDEVFSRLGDKTASLRERLSKGALTVEEVVKTLKAQKRDLAKHIEAIPARIDEASLARPSVTLAGDEKERFQALEAEAEKLRSTIAGKKANVTADDEIRRITEAISKERLALTGKEAQLKADLKEQEGEFQSQKLRESYLQKELANKVTALKEEIEELSQARKELIAQFQDVKNEKFVRNNICPCCGQEIPPDKLKVAEEAFNQDKSERLETINKKGQACNLKSIEGKKAEIIKIEQETLQADERMEGLDKQLENLRKAYEVELEVQANKSKEAIEHLEKKARSIELSSSKFMADVSAEEEALKDIQNKQDDLMALMSQHELIAVQDARISQLKAEQKDLSAKYEELEGLLYEAEVFTREKAGQLNDLINGNFKSVRFVLTEEQVNGGVKDVCEVLVPCGDGVYVPFSTANNAARINAGLEIIASLSDYWDVSVPVVIDNAESVTKLNSRGLQTLALYVSEKDKTLRVETE